jgi:ribosomal protein S18 acetylase RimI-like enzyme
MLVARIQAYLRTAAGGGRHCEQIGPFLATFDPHSDNLFLNYAIPEDGAEPPADEIAALVAAYERRGRRPRLEYVDVLAPGVAQALAGRGFKEEMRTPLMTCTPERLRSMPVPEGIEVRFPEADADFAAMAAAQSEAFGEEAAVYDAEIGRLRESIARGSIYLMARDTHTGECAGAGVCTSPKNGITEVAGIGVRPQFRRRGIAGFLTARLTETAFERGVELAFLMAGPEEGARGYSRPGFEAVGEVLHVSKQG